MLSHGMLKRIAIAQAFLGAPEVVLLDEPTAGLDPATASEMKNLIRSLDKERTFVISSHNLQDIEELCGSVVILDRGKIVEHRKVSELVARTSCLTFRLEADPPETIVAQLTAVALVTRVELGRPGERRLAVHFRDEGEGGNKTQIAVLQALTAAGVGMIEMTRGQSLQDKVIEMTRPAGEPLARSRRESWYTKTARISAVDRSRVTGPGHAGAAFLTAIDMRDPETRDLSNACESCARLSVFRLTLGTYS